jgi:hypothetical protein
MTLRPSKSEGLNFQREKRIRRMKFEIEYFTDGVWHTVPRLYQSVDDLLINLKVFLDLFPELSIFRIRKVTLSS